MTKLFLKLGAVEIHLEGEESWIKSTYDKVFDDLEKLGSLNKRVVVSESVRGETATTNEIENTPALPIFLSQKNATKSQNQKFLATAVWLHSRGKNRLTVSDVTSALSQNNQGRLGNPSDVLSQNVGKGFCEKDGKEFFVTPEGKAALSSPS